MSRLAGGVGGSGGGGDMGALEEGPLQHVRARWVTLRARWVMLRARWVTLRARWVTLRARWVTLRSRWVTFRWRSARRPRDEPSSCCARRWTRWAAGVCTPRVNSLHQIQDTGG
jgi:hypothetical protein